jgi:hypothetical protein
MIATGEIGSGGTRPDILRTAPSKEIALGAAVDGIAWERLSVRRVGDELSLVGENGSFHGAVMISIGQAFPFDHSSARIAWDGSFGTIAIRAKPGSSVSVKISFGAALVPGPGVHVDHEMTFVFVAPNDSRPLTKCKVVAG